MDKAGETCDESPLYSSDAPESTTWKAMAISRQYCGLIVETDGPFKQTIAKIGRSKVFEYFNACVFDVMEMSPNKTEAKDVACQSLNAFADESKEANIIPDRSWRNITGCAYKC